MSVRLYIILLLLFTAFSGVYAQTSNDEFTVRVFTGDDDTPPSTPTIISVDPVAPTQIDLSWTASTDNVTLSGYNIERDGVYIATTSLTSYSDTGLTPETLYAYTVRAFDTFSNYSSSSASVSTTTPAIPPPPVTPTTTLESSSVTEGTAVRLILDSFGIETSATGAELNWETRTHGRYILRWGRTSNYELGSVISDVYRRSHQTTITDLEPGTTYSYTLIGITPSNIETVLKTGEFTTQVVDITDNNVLNVSGFSAESINRDVLLSWENPNMEDFSFVRVIRNHWRFPLDPNDGAVVYQGRGESFYDREALSEYSPQHYTIFVYNENNQRSSGAVTMAYLVEAVSGGDGGSSNNIVYPEPTEAADLEEIPSSNDSTEVFESTSHGARFGLEDISIVQANRELLFSDPILRIDPDLPFSVRIKVVDEKPRISSIVVSIKNPTNHRQKFDFLLKLNADRTYYVANISPVKVEGISGISVAVYDWNDFVVSRYNKQLEFVKTEGLGEVIFPDQIFKYLNYTWWMWLLLVLILTIFFFWLILFWKRRKKEVEDKP